MTSNCNKNPFQKVSKAKDIIPFAEIILKFGIRSRVGRHVTTIVRCNEKYFLLVTQLDTQNKLYTRQRTWISLQRKCSVNGSEWHHKSINSMQMCTDFIMSTYMEMNYGLHADFGESFTRWSNYLHRMNKSNVTQWKR